MSVRPGVSAVGFLCLFASVSSAQPDRITAPIDGRRSVLVRGSVPYRARPAYDQGPVDSGFPLGNITLLLKPSARQQADLEQLLAQQQDPASPNYHKWLTPEEYATRFGASSADLEQIADWLRSQGFSVRYTARGRDFISFSGTAGQVETALHTPIHRYRIGAETHFSNAGDLALPAAVEPMVGGILGLDDFHPRPHHKRAFPTFTGADGTHYLLPDDLATIYDFMPMYSYGYLGDGQSIVIVGQSDVDLTDVQSFRDTFGLPATRIQMVPTGNYPGFDPNGEVEADLDLEWAGAVARSAQLIFVYSDDANYSAFYAIDNNLAPVISESFGLCEYQIGSNRMGLASFEPEAQKANALGITWLVSSGDSGAAGCDDGVPVATQGMGVSLPASIPEVTAVGGTEFNEGGGSYWSNGNGLYGGSALSYIPETSWNDTVALGSLAASGGGVSSIYRKPSWQAGPGVPADGARDVPDVSLAAASAHDPYLVVSQGSVIGVGGTSAAAPSFAGMVALLNEYLVKNQVQSNAGLGNINPKLYSLAAGGATGIFHDITTGNNIVPCQAGTPNCDSGQFGYRAGPGYDLVTGLGSVDAFNLFTTWSGLSVTSTTTSLTAAPPTMLPGGSTMLTAAVKAAGGSRTPAGVVTFTSGANTLGAVALAGSGGTASASLTIYGGQLLAASNTIQANYGGSPIFSPSSATTIVTVGPASTASAVTLSITPNPVYQQPPDANGATFSFTIKLTETAGVPTTVTGFIFDGVSYTGSLEQFFGNTSLPAHGTVSASLSASNIPVPSSVNILFTGRDAGGTTWTRQLAVPFLPQPTGQ